MSSLSRSEANDLINKMEEQLRRLRNRRLYIQNDNEDAENLLLLASNNHVLNPSSFPSNTSGQFTMRDSLGDPVGTLNIVFPIMDRISFPNHPLYQIKGDVDSIYTYNRSLKELILSLESNNTRLGQAFCLHSCINPAKKLAGSRFFVDTSRMSSPPLYRGREAKKVCL